MRRSHLCRRAQVSRVPHADARVVVLFDWDPADLGGFTADPAVRETRNDSGTLNKPDFEFLDAIADLSA